VDNFKAQWEYVANEGTGFAFMTNLDAPRYRVVQTDLTAPGEPETWRDVIPQHHKDLLQWASALKGDSLVVCYLRDVRSALELRSLATGNLRAVLPLPGIGSVAGFSGRRQDSEAFFKFTSFTEPGAIYRFDTEQPELEPQIFRRIKLQCEFEPDDFVTRQEFFHSADGTRVPMFVVHKKGLALDGCNPTLLYGYGGFNISLEPGFSVARLCYILAYNGVYAVANLRGGGEYGTGWRDAGSKQHKQNVFDDFQAAAEHLQAEGYCSPATTTIQGGSNGGLLVAACANQRPDLYAAVLAQVGVMDMLRFHKFTIVRFHPILLSICF
jgi:prolyl oligopeptidase